MKRPNIKKHLPFVVICSCFSKNLLRALHVPSHGEIHCSSVGSRWVLLIYSKWSCSILLKTNSKTIQNSSILEYLAQKCKNAKTCAMSKIWRNDEPPHIWTHDMILHPTSTALLWSFVRTDGPSKNYHVSCECLDWSRTLVKTTYNPEKGYVSVWFSETVKAQLPELQKSRSALVMYIWNILVFIENKSIIYNIKYI